MSQRLNASTAKASTAGTGPETGAGPVHRYERYNAQNSRAWMISDSPDGRIPAMTPQAQQRLVSGDAAPVI